MKDLNNSQILNVDLSSFLSLLEYWKWLHQSEKISKSSCKHFLLGAPDRSRPRGCFHLKSILKPLILILTAPHALVLIWTICIWISTLRTQTSFFSISRIHCEVFWRLRWSATKSTWKLAYGSYAVHKHHLYLL